MTLVITCYIPLSSNNLLFYVEHDIAAANLCLACSFTGCNQDVNERCPTCNHDFCEEHLSGSHECQKDDDVEVPPTPTGTPPEPSSTAPPGAVQQESQQQPKPSSKMGKQTKQKPSKSKKVTKRRRQDDSDNDEDSDFSLPDVTVEAPRGTRTSSRLSRGAGDRCLQANRQVQTKAKDYRKCPNELIFSHVWRYVLYAYVTSSLQPSLILHSRCCFYTLITTISLPSALSHSHYCYYTLTTVVCTEHK